MKRLLDTILGNDDMKEYDTSDVMGEEKVDTVETQVVFRVSEGEIVKAWINPYKRKETKKDVLYYLRSKLMQKYPDDKIIMSKNSIIRKSKNETKIYEILSMTREPRLMCGDCKHFVRGEKLENFRQKGQCKFDEKDTENFKFCHCKDLV